MEVIVLVVAGTNDDNSVGYAKERGMPVALSTTGHWMAHCKSRFQVRNK